MTSATIQSNAPGSSPVNILDSANISLLRAGSEDLFALLTAYEEEWASSPDTEGSFRTRSRPQNVDRPGKVRIRGASPAAVAANIALWQGTIESVRRNKGTIVYTPRSGPAVTFRVESASISRIEQDQALLANLWTTSDFRVTCLPYGELAAVDIIPVSSAVTSTDPVLEAELPDVPGSVDAKAIATLIDLEGEDRSDVVWGLDTNYDPVSPTPVLLAANSSGFSVNAANFDAGFAGASDTQNGFSVLRVTLMASPMIICGSGPQTHLGVWRHFVRAYGSGTGPIWIRLVYKLGSSPRFTEGDWKELQGLSAFFEVDLGLMQVTEAVQGTQTCEWRIEAYSETPGDTLAIHFDQLIPEPGGKARAPFALVTPSIYAVRDEFNQGGNPPLDGQEIGAASVSEGPLSGATFVDDATFGDLAWSSPGNAASHNAAYASAGFSTNVVEQHTTHYLKATNFGFTVPDGATIRGVKVEVERHETVNNAAISVHTLGAFLVKGSGSPVAGNERAIASLEWPSGDSYATLGGEVDLFGNSLTPAEVRSSNFGVAVRASMGCTSSGAFLKTATAYIDHIRITVYYTPAGGFTWARTGDTDDFVVDSASHTAQRTAVSDAAGAHNGCFEIAGSRTYTDCAAQITTSSSLPGSGGNAERGLALRYTNTSNFLIVVTQASTGKLEITKRVAGTPTTILSKTFAKLQAPGPFAIVPIVTAAGVVAVFVDGELLVVTSDSALATGGALASGKVDLYDHKTSPTAETRAYDNFAVWGPAFDHVLYANRSAEIHSDKMSREHSSGEWGRIATEGAYLSIPPAGREGKVSRLVVKARRNDVDVLPDNVIDDALSVSLTVTPRVSGP